MAAYCLFVAAPKFPTQTHSFKNPMILNNHDLEYTQNIGDAIWFRGYRSCALRNAQQQSFTPLADAPNLSPKLPVKPGEVISLDTLRASVQWKVNCMCAFLHRYVPIARLLPSAWEQIWCGQNTSLGLIGIVTSLRVEITDNKFLRISIIEGDQHICHRRGP